MAEPFSDVDEPLETVPASMLDVDRGIHGTQNHFSDAEADDYALEDEDEMPKFDPKPSNEAEIRELLRYVSSSQALC